MFFFFPADYHDLQFFIKHIVWLYYDRNPSLITIFRHNHYLALLRSQFVTHSNFVITIISFIFHTATNAGTNVSCTYIQNE